MLFKSNVSKIFGREVVNIILYTMNVVKIKQGTSKTPYELLFFLFEKRGKNLFNQNQDIEHKPKAQEKITYSCLPLAIAQESQNTPKVTHPCL